jgi:hypothetical protein
MDEDPAPKPAKKAEGGAGTSNPYKSTKKGAFHTFLRPLTAKAQRAAMRSLNATVPKVRQYVRWSKMPVQWSRDDHAENIPDGYYAMVVNPLIQGYGFSKCLMDGGSSLNIMYVETLTKLGLTKTQLRHSAVTFYGVVPGRQAKSLGSITLKVAFGDENNYREEPITFEVVPFKSTYHVIFGRSAFHSFHARPCYIYNQLKMPRPEGIIIVYGSFRKAKECEDGEAPSRKQCSLVRNSRKSIPPQTPRKCRHPSKKYPPPRPPSSLQLIQSRWNLSLAMPPRPPQ